MADALRLAWLNGLRHDAATAAFLQCCPVRAWADAMAARRPFADADEVFDTAETVWWQLGPAAWREAFHGHPRIGERKAAAPLTTTEQSWSVQEQSNAQDADSAVRAELANGQRVYEERFGHIFLICATGRSAEEMLAALRERLRNDPDTELRVAAVEQRRITHLRLEKLLAS